MVVFSLYINYGANITPANVFTAFAVLSLLRFPLAFAPFILIQWSNLRVSLKRIQGSLKSRANLEASENRTPSFTNSLLSAVQTPISISSLRAKLRRSTSVIPSQCWAEASVGARHR